MPKTILDYFSKTTVTPKILDKVQKPLDILENEEIITRNVPFTNPLSTYEGTGRSNKYKRLKMISDSDEKNVRPPESKKLKNELNESFKDNEDDINHKPSNKGILTKSIIQSSHSKINEPVSVNNEVLSTKDDESFVKDSYDHLAFEFLKKDSIMDSQKRRPDHTLYDASTLFIPSDFMSKLTPAMRQWWQMKATGMNDTLLFFKVGKFYELYHMDAVVAANELGISFMRGSYAHCGFPEIAFTKMADQLVKKGYKVGRVEQTETVEVMTERCKGRPTKEKVVKREICQVVTPGTRTFSLRNGSTRAITQDDGEDITFDDNVGAMLYSLRETQIEDAFINKSRFVMDIGVSVVNTNTGKFMLAQFEDDKQRSKLRTMFARFPPNEILYQKGDVSKDTNHLLNTTMASIKKEAMGKIKQFLSSEDTLERLLEDGYFNDTPKDRLSVYGLPTGLIEVLSEGDNLGRTANPKYALAVNSLGGLIYYLKKCLIDTYCISQADFVIYHPTDQFVDEYKHLPEKNPFYVSQSNMILDSNALQNLDLLKNIASASTEGTLLERLDFTSTSFGKRLLLQWIATPLCHPSAIKDRQDSIVDLINLESRLRSVRQKMKSLPDLEKLLSRIHAVGLSTSVADHPDSRAVLYENIKYSRKKINDFITTITAFRTIIHIQALFNEFNFERKLRSSLLKSIMLCKDDDEIGLFPDLDDHVTYFQEAFNHDNAKKEGKIIPGKGVDSDYDDAMDTIEKVKCSLDEYLKDQSKLFDCKLNYFGTGKNRFQLEIPDSKCKNVPKSYIASSQKKGFKRYETSETQRLLADMIAAEDRRDVALQNIMSRIFAKFDEHYLLWSRAIFCLAQLDVLMSLSVFSRGVDGGPMVQPQIKELSHGVKPFLLITEGRYPSKAKIQTGEFISNTISLGNSSPSDNDGEVKRVMILTGPNMGGKSTLMKQTALIIILSQLGCHVPAEGPVILTPVDRLLTRQGASDAISSGQSTLQVELNETASIMSSMTENSFLMVDELGRGTSTHDGCALAFSILTNIVERCEPRTIFSTHFHKLLEDKRLTDTVQLSHMACMVEDDIEDGSSIHDAKLQNITFLYKLTAGSCPKSYGFNVARLANIPEKIIMNGLKKAKLFEEETLILELKRSLVLASGDDTEARQRLTMWQQKCKRLYLL